MLRRTVDALTLGDDGPNEEKEATADNVEGREREVGELLLKLAAKAEDTYVRNEIWLGAIVRERHDLAEQIGRLNINNIMDKSEAERMEKEATRELWEMEDVRTEENETSYETADRLGDELDFEMTVNERLAPKFHGLRSTDEVRSEEDRKGRSEMMARHPDDFDDRTNKSSGRLSSKGQCCQ